MIRKNWDCYEVALLIDIYYKMQRCTTSKEKNEKLEHLSSLLRTYAVNQGLEIDEKYRNLNGMILQLSHMEYVITDGKKGLSNSPKIFVKIFDTYCGNREEYEKILRKANELMDNTITEKGQKEQFICWLSEQYDSNRVSEILSTLLDVEECLHRRNLLFGSVYDIPFEKEAKKMFVSLKENKIFRILHIRKMSLVEASMHAILLFLKNKKKSDEAYAKQSSLVDTHQENKVPNKAKKNDIIVGSKKVKLMSALERKNSFFYWLRDKEGLADESCRSYILAMDGAENFAKEHQLSFENIYGSNYSEVKSYIEELFQNKDFNEFNEVGHNRFRAALSKYLQFIGGENAAPRIMQQEELADLSSYRELLAEKYEKGFRIESGIEMKKFRHFWEEKYGTVLALDDDTIRKYIGRVTIRYQDFAYLPETMLAPEKKSRLLSYVVRNLEDGKTAIYFDALFNEFTIDLQEEQIHNPAMLKAYMSYFNPGSYYIRRGYLTADNQVEINPVNEIRSYLILHGTIISTDELCGDLSNLPSKKISNVLATNKEFINNSKGEYFHANAVDISDDELSNIAELIQRAIDDKHFMTGTELIEEMKAKYPSVLERQTQYSVFGMRDAIGYKLDGAYSFNGNIISEAGQSLSMYDVYADYCKKRTHITLNELNNLKQALNSVIYFEAVYKNTLRISENDFVSAEQASFDVKETDEAIDRFCTGTYIPITEINHFGSFPDAEFTWNCYLLGHYVAGYSSNYKLLHTSFNANSCVGAIVKRSTGIEDYNDILTDVLANNDATLNREAALQYLCERGLLAKRRYKDIDQILVKATAIRTQKG